jgi:branched-chain amino acid transport system substrate-binding protein
MKRLRLLSLMGAALMLAVASCGGDDSSDSSSKSASSGSSTSSKSSGIPDGPIKIGLAIALTGPINIFDGDMLTGAKVAMNEINAKGGVDGHKIELLTADTKSDIAQGGSAGLRVISDGAQFVIPTLDYNFGGGAARAANSKGLISISSAGDLRFGLKIGPHHFNMYVGAPTEGASIAEFAATTKGWKTAYVLTDTTIAHETETCKAFKESFQALGGKIGGDDTFQQGDSSIATQATRMRNAQDKVDFVMLCSYPPGAVAALRQLRSAGITKPIMLDQAMEGNNWQKGLKDTTNLFGVSTGALTPGEEQDPKIAKLFDDATKLTGKPNNFGLGLLTGYSAVEAIADGVSHTNSVNSDEITKYWETYKDHPLVIGPTTWTADCHTAIGRPMETVTFEGGQVRYLGKVQATKIPEPSC